MTMLIYSFENRLFIHSESIIHVGHVDIFLKNKRLRRYKLSTTNFFSCQPDLKPEHYTVRVYDESGKLDEKRVFLSDVVREQKDEGAIGREGEGAREG